MIKVVYMKKQIKKILNIPWDAILIDSSVNCLCECNQVIWASDYTKLEYK